MASLNDTVKYLDLTGLTKYDALIKALISGGDAAVEKKLTDALAEGGAVPALIENAISALKGTLTAEDSTTLEAINSELNGIDSALNTLKGDVNTAGSVAKAVKDGIDGINADAMSETGKPIVSVSQTHGVVSATAGTITANNVTVNWGDGENPVSSTANVQTALDEVYEKISANATAGEVAVYHTPEGSSTPVKVDAIHADGTDYVLKQGTTTVATLNIAKDMVVSGGEVITADGTEKKNAEESAGLTAGLKYIKLTLANSADILYIAVNDLYDDYTFNNANGITFTETNNSVSASIDDNSIAFGKLNNELQTKISSAATLVNAKADGHVTVTVTAANGSNPAQVTIAENDIASATALSDEVTRATGAEDALANKIGLTDGAYTTEVVLAEGATKTVVADINKLNSRLGTVETFITNLTAITEKEISDLFVVKSEKTED